MGEIKSTLDLVMEKTRNLSLTPEEKTDQKRADYEKRLQGLLQQYEDNAVSIDMLQEGIRGLQEASDVAGSELTVDAVFKRIDPDRDNQRWLDLLDRFVPAAGKPLQEVLLNYGHRLADLTDAAGQRQRDRLTQRHGIQGTAVQPNPGKDVDYQEKRADLKTDTQNRLDAVLQEHRSP